jgi:hypothetical protein
MSLGLQAGITTALATAAVVAYIFAWFGFALEPWLVTAVGLLAGAWAARGLGTKDHAHDVAPFPAWLLVVVAAFVMLLWPTWPALLPRGGASDLTHHLMLVDVIERTGHLPDGTASEAALGEMAHYTPGLHLLIAIAGHLASVDAYRTAYLLLALTIALKAGVVFLIAYDVLAGVAARLPVAVAAVGLVLFAPRAYSLDGFLQAGFYAQVASEAFVLAGWWGLTRWWRAPASGWMAFVGLMAGAVFVVWPIWIGPLMVAVALAVWQARGFTWPARARLASLAVGPPALVAALHLSRHATWLRMAGTSGAVPAFSPGVLGWMLLALAPIGMAGLRRPHARVTLWFTLGLVLQAGALWLLAWTRGAETPYMAMKMIYLAVYPTAVLAALGIAVVIHQLHVPARPAAWAAAALVLAIGLRAAAASPPPPLVSTDLDAAGRWARAHLQPACVDYIVDNAEQAYWLHLAVMGQPRSSPRTTDIDGYTTNRAVGRWLQGEGSPYTIARVALLPGEVLREAKTLATFGTAVVIHRSGVACPLPIANR